MKKQLPIATSINTLGKASEQLFTLQDAMYQAVTTGRTTLPAARWVLSASVSAALEALITVNQLATALDEFASEVQSTKWFDRTQATSGLLGANRVEIPKTVARKLIAKIDKIRKQLNAKGSNKTAYVREFRYDVWWDMLVDNVTAIAKLDEEIEALRRYRPFVNR